MSRSRPQDVAGEFSFVNLAVQNHLNFSTLNTVPLISLTKGVVSTVPNVDDFLAGGFAIDGEYLLDLVSWNFKEVKLTDFLF